MRRFLQGQTRQEAVHALVLQRAAAWLAPKYLGDSPLLTEWLVTEELLAIMGQATVMRIESKPMAES